MLMKKYLLFALLALVCTMTGTNTLSAQSQWGANLLKNTTEVGTVHDIPFFEGFEAGNEQGHPVAGWLQRNTYGDSLWTANSALTNAPFGGNWNVTLCKNNANWLFTYLVLEAGKTYRFSMYAQQGNNSGYHRVEVHIGTNATYESMNIEVLPTTYLAGRDYQLLSGTFSVPESHVYALGIRGYVAYNGKALNIDDVRVTEIGPRNIRTFDTDAGIVTPDKSVAQFGDTVRLRRTMAEGEIFIRYTTDVAVVWVNDSSFVMPDADVTVGLEVLPMHTLPFSEGFENGNTQDRQPVGWVQQSEQGTKMWQANSTQTNYHRTPYEGKWNATLPSNNTGWLFTGVQLETGTEYDMWLYARQNWSGSLYANIRVALGNGIDKDSMRMEIIPEKGLTKGDYQLLHCCFSVPASGRYVLGIRGYISSNPDYLSIDDIHIQERIVHPICTTDAEYGALTLSKTEAYMGDTVSVEYAMNEGYYFRAYTMSVPVRWIDEKRFIMPGTAVTVGIDAITPRTIPFFEGFETGNTQGAKVVGWATQSEYRASSEYWKANTTETGYNRTPYVGDWNVTLHYGEPCWLFKPLTLEAGNEYVLAFRTRQDGNNMAAYVKACLGTDCDKDSMKVCIVKTQTIVNGDYRLILARFSVATSGNYVLGIRGSISSSSYYLSLDNVSVVKRTARQYAVASAPSGCGAVAVNANRAYVGDTITVSRTMNTGYAFYRYTTTASVKWVTDSTFVMPDEDVTVGMDAIQGKSLPFFEGFEEGNTNNQPMVDWIIEGVGGQAYNQWMASKNNPYEGTWSARLVGWNNSSWIYNAVNLEAGKTYTVSLRARQEAANSSPKEQTICVCLGSSVGASAMTTTLVQTTVIEPGGDYQTIVGAFTVLHTATYVLGICGHTGTSMPVEIDNIRLQEKDYTLYTVSVADSVYGGPVIEQSSATMGDTIAVSHTLDATYIFMEYFTDIPVLWIDRHHFIMPDANVTVRLGAAQEKTIPFFEGFEEGNTQGNDVVGWLQWNETGSESWKANSTETQYNQTPYQGSWNAVLKLANTDWLCQAFTFEKGKAYKVSLYARQDGGYKGNAIIRICLGSEMNRESMTTEVLSATGIVNGDYQLLEAVFAVPATAVYALGIRGYINGIPCRLSIDNISVEEVPVEEVTPVVSAVSLDISDTDEKTVRKALKALTLAAVDAKDSVVYTFANKADLWTVDWTLNEASYLLRSSELPANYTFANEVETVRVALRNIGTGVDNAAVSTLQVYPNPAVDYICVAGAADAIAVYDLAGHVVLSVSSAGEKTVIDITALPSGLYMLRSAGKIAPVIVK